MVYSSSPWTVLGLLTLSVAVLNNATNIGRYRHKLTRELVTEATAVQSNSQGVREESQQEHGTTRLVEAAPPLRQLAHDSNNATRRHSSDSDDKFKDMSSGASLEDQSFLQDATVPTRRKDHVEALIAKDHTYRKKVENVRDEQGNAPFDEPEKCTPWNISLDDWWQDHPEWEPSQENDTHACFRRIVNPLRVRFLQEVHAIQFSAKCNHKPAIRNLFQMGFAATLLFHLNAAFWSAFRQGRLFLAGIPHEGFQWLYASKEPWVSCSTNDHECFFLPVSNCTRPIGAQDEQPKKKYIYGEVFGNATLAEQNMWLSHYLMRPRQALRHELYKFMKQGGVPQIPPGTPCTWMHVRRADAMTETHYKRNYYLLQEYLTRGKVSKRDPILLLTDDRTTLEEAHALHPDHQWIYWNRTRHRGPAPFNAHIPSGDPALEVLIIMAERQLASQCHKGVFGRSNMATLFSHAMVLEQGGRGNVTLIEIDGRLKKTRIEPEAFVKQLELQLAAAGKQTIT